MATHTHIGFSREVGHVHSGRLYGHADYRGKTHALNGCSNIYSGAGYKALCGKIVVADHDGYSFNVSTASDEDYISCKKCRRLVQLEKQEHTCRYCGHHGTAGADGELCRETRNYGGLYACKDADACGVRIRAVQDTTPQEAWNEIPF